MLLEAKISFKIDSTSIQQVSRRLKRGAGGQGGRGETSLFNKTERTLKQMLKPFSRAFIAKIKGKQGVPSVSRG